MVAEEKPLPDSCKLNRFFFFIYLSTYTFLTFLFLVRIYIKPYYSSAIISDDAYLIYTPIK